MTLLAVRGLTRRFGGVVATDRVDLDIARGEVHALIGPNGAGKTTFIAQLAGALRPDRGTLMFGGVRIESLPMHRRVALGLARSYQITQLFDRLPAVENAALAVLAATGSSFRFWQPVRLETTVVDTARRLLARVDLADRAGVPAGELAHGEQRRLEIALALAAQPRLLLLDEPMSGMGPEDSARMVGLIAELKSEMSLLLVEHDMDAVFRLADRVSVLVNGRVLESGSPDAIRASRAVQDAYLGTEVSE